MTVGGVRRGVSALGAVLTRTLTLAVHTAGVAAARYGCRKKLARALESYQNHTMRRWIKWTPRSLDWNLIPPLRMTMGPSFP